MKKISKSIMAVALASVAAIGAYGQNTQSGYFLEDYTYRFQMNPAYGNTRNFVAMPALGNLNLGVQGNLHLSDILYNVNGRTTTFLNPSVAASEVLGSLSDMNRIGGSERINILSAGFKAFGGYNTISVGARVDFGFRLPKSIFSLLKEGVENKTYSIEGLGAFANAYAEVSLGHSRNITPEIRVGANLKFLVGGGNLKAKLNRADLTLGTDDWSIVSDAEIESSVKGLYYKEKLNEHTGHRYVNSADIDGAGIGGFGMAVDLGAVYSPKILRDWTFSLALLDLGFIGWNNNMLASTNGPKSFNTDRYTFSFDSDATNSFDREKDKIRDDISALYELENMGDQGGRTTALGATMNVGAQYTFPLYRKLNFGLLNTTRIQGDYSWTDFRLSANVAPVKCFDATADIAMGTFGFSFGWMLNLHVPGFNLFLGMDHTPGKLAKQGVPLSSNGQVNFGINFLF
ncbi:MAG: DUF5723 family protein [Clostridium sp.]|nr:DUF5723 family protein [Clostridium sp.]